MVSAILHKLTEMLLLSYQYLHLQTTSNKTQEVSFIETNKNTKNPETKFTVSDHLLAFKFDDNISEYNRRTNKKGEPTPKKITIANGDIFSFFDDVLGGLKAMCDYIVFYKFQEKSQEQEKQEYLFCFLIKRLFRIRFCGRV